MNYLTKVLELFGKNITSKASTCVAAQYKLVIGVYRLSSSEPLREPVHEPCSEICYLLESRDPTGPTLNVLN